MKKLLNYLISKRKKLKKNSLPLHEPNLTKVDETPLFTEVIGIIIGCVLGIYIPKAIKGVK